MILHWDKAKHIKRAKFGSPLKAVRYKTKKPDRITVKRSEIDSFQLKQGVSREWLTWYIHTTLQAVLDPKPKVRLSLGVEIIEDTA